MSESLFATFFAKETSTQVFSYEICKIFKSSYFEEHLRTAASKNIILWFCFGVQNITYFQPVNYFSLACSNNPFTANTEDGGLPRGETIPREFENMTRSWVQVINYAVGSHRKFIQGSGSSKLLAEVLFC